MVWILHHSQCNNNIIVSEVSMIIKDTSACSLESNPEWVCAWLTSWLAFGCVPQGSDTASDGPLLHVIWLSRTYYHGFLSIASTRPEFDLVTSFLTSVFTDSRFYVYT